MKMGRRIASYFALCILASFVLCACGSGYYDELLMGHKFNETTAEFEANNETTLLGLTVDSVSPRYEGTDEVLAGIVTDTTGLEYDKCEEMAKKVEDVIGEAPTEDHFYEGAGADECKLHKLLWFINGTTIGVTIEKNPVSGYDLNISYLNY